MQSASGILRMLLYCAGCELDDKRCVIRLNFRLVSCFIPYHRTASVTLMDYYVSLLRIGLSLYGAQNSSAIVRSVSGINIHVQRTEAEGAMITGGVAEGQYLASAILADKSVIVFCKSFLFHNYLILIVSPGATFTVMLPEINQTVRAVGLCTMLPLAENSRAR